MSEIINLIKVNVIPISLMVVAALVAWNIFTGFTRLLALLASISIVVLFLGII